MNFYHGGISHDGKLRLDASVNFRITRKEEIKKEIKQNIYLTVFAMGNTHF